MKRIQILFLSALAAAPFSAAALEPMSASELVESCDLQLSNSGVAAQGCSAYILGYLAGSSEARIGFDQWPTSDLVQRAIQTRAPGRAEETPAPLYCIPEDAEIDRLAGQIVQVGATSAAEDSAGNLVRRVLQQFYRCAPV